MSDRLINLFLRDVKKTNDGIMPEKIPAVVVVDGVEIEGNIIGFNDGAGVMLMEQGETSPVRRLMLRYASVSVISSTRVA